ncbi:hypothetical protein [Streptomyces sp. NPDC004528]|uniref:hypothetical protein n=1 Tax=Streptomyces sp. NPDC004528 TaxID=3154550 RepID=UPI0033B637CA
MPEELHVKMLTAMIPVSAEQLLDAGMELPHGMAPPAAPRPLPWRTRWRVARATWIWAARMRLGFWIAGQQPDDEDW